MLAIVVRYDDQLGRCTYDKTLHSFDRSAATVVNLVETAVKLASRAPTMLSRRRKARKAVGPRSYLSSERRRSNPILLPPCCRMETRAGGALQTHLRNTLELPASWLMILLKLAPIFSSPRCILLCLSCIKINYAMLSAKWAYPSNRIAWSRLS